ncbi:CGNR zinc finger domain-containing protein [Saccharopolyspora taberi]|uniref:CGNR zinc finger domain-containing protein n=1 Tax=Saccharopolyspora taberi TaxID=60895 RepID=A0ABN3VI65_9PSEU
MGDWVWDGGRPCLDLVNTVRDRYLAGRELLREPADLAEWLRRAELADAVPAEDQLRAARELREAVDRAVRAERPDPADVELINSFARDRHRAATEIRLAGNGSAVAWTPPPADPVRAALGALAADAVDLITAERAQRVRICASDRCGIRFVDASPARNRQWCSMARCGNREKARQHYARRKAGS